MQALLFLTFVLVVFFALRFIINTLIEARQKNAVEQNEQSNSSVHSMVRCAHCGVHLPQSEAYFDGRHTYCSEGHMKLGPKVSKDMGPDNDQEDDGD